MVRGPEKADVVLSQGYILFTKEIKSIFVKHLVCGTLRE